MGEKRRVGSVRVGWEDGGGGEECEEFGLGGGIVTTQLLLSYQTFEPTSRFSNSLTASLNPFKLVVI